MAAVLFLNLFVFALVGVVLAWNLDHERSKATLVADNLGRVLEENLSRVIDKINLTLMAVVDEVERQERAGGIDRTALEAFIARHDARLPEALGIRVVSSAGMIDYAVTNTPLTSRAEISDRDHFTRHRDNPDLGLYISPPIIGRLNPQPMIILARKRTAPDGSFGGIVHVAVAVSTLTNLFSSVDIGDYGSVGLWNEASTLLGRYSRVAAPTSGITTPSAELRRLIEARSPPAAYTAVSGVDGIERIFFYRQVERHPLFLIVGVSAQDFLVGWRREAIYLVGLAAIFLLGSLAAAQAIQRTMTALEQARAEADSERRHSNLVLASVGEGICGIDANGRVTFANDVAKRMLGWSDDDYLGMDLHHTAHHHRADGTDYPASDCPIGRLLRQTSPVQSILVADEVYWRRDGTSFPVEYTGAPIVEDGRVIGAVNVFRDITERKRSDAAMAHTLATTQVLGNCLRLSLQDMSLDQLLDAALKELLSLPWLNLENRGCIFVADQGQLRMAAQHNLPPRISAGCARIPVGSCLCGLAAARRDIVFSDCVDHRHETRFDGMAEHGHYCVPIMGGDKTLGVLNTYVAHGHRRDDEEVSFLQMYAHTLAGIIKRKQAEDSLRGSEALAKTLMNAPADAAFLMDRSGTVLAANEAIAARFHTSAESLIGQSFFDRIAPDLAIARRSQFEAVLATKAPLHTHDERDGYALDNRIYPVLDGDGAVIQVAVFSRDVTEQRRAAQVVEKALADLEHSNRELEQFAYVASHDLRQPLRMISSYLALVQKRLGSQLSPEIEEFIGFAVGGAKRMDALILGLLEYSKIGRGTVPFAPVALAEVIAEARLNLEVAVREAAAVIEVGGAPVSLPGDRSELARLFQNLIGNAVKYRSPERPPRIRIDWSPGEAGWRVSVADNGTGIDSTNFDRAFGIFQRLVASDTIEGTGIGLAICKKIVEHHGGRIWIESELGRGTTFHFTLKA